MLLKPEPCVVAAVKRRLAIADRRGVLMRCISFGILAVLPLAMSAQETKVRIVADAVECAPRPLELMPFKAG